MKVRLSLLCFLGASACGDDAKGGGTDPPPNQPEQTDSGTEQATGASLTDEGCSLLKEGAADDELIGDDYDRCAAACFLSASCADLGGLLCSEEVDSNNASVSCLRRCPANPKDGYACADGTLIAHFFVCDDEEDCADGSDEQGCELHVCDDGEQLSVSDVQCDDTQDCADGSDEAGCVNLCR